jgi:hypothetical protein
MLPATSGGREGRVTPKTTSGRATASRERERERERERKRRMPERWVGNGRVYGTS